jgi:predicted AlkP superfamily phosphohydrolase/phosphomutase
LWDQASGGGDALLDVYRVCDRALGRLLAATPESARVLVFAVHGMGPNTAWADRCADLLTRITSGGQTAAQAPKRGLLFSLKQLIPWQVARVVTTRLPQRLQHRLVELWSRRMFDWSRTRAFPLPMDHAGYVRINLRGREPAGIVEPGAEYDALCSELAEAFAGFRDLTTGQPIVRRIYRQDELGPAAASARHRLPDLVIEWDGVPPAESPGVVSPKFGEVRWPHAQLPSGRSGNHRGEGWFVAAGPGIPAGRTVDGHHIMDLVPTACAWLGADLDRHFLGRRIGALTA